MLSAKLFLGFQVSDDFEWELKRVNPKLLDLFLQGGNEYLQDKEINGIRYLGKIVGEITDLSKLKLFKKNILSLINRLVPSYSHKEEDIVLFPITEELE